MGDKTEGKLEKKQEKKLKKFLDLELSLPNRFKYLVDIVGRLTHDWFIFSSVNLIFKLYYFLKSSLVAFIYYYIDWIF